MKHRLFHVKRLVIVALFAGMAVFLMRCHSPVGGSATSTLIIGTEPLSNTEWSLVLEVADASIRRTGGCANGGAQYDGCVFAPNPVGSTIRLGLKVCQSGDQAMLQFTDFSREAYPDRENTGLVNNEPEDCWTAVGAAPPETRTPCFAGTATTPGRFYVKGDITVVPDVGFRFYGVTTQRLLNPLGTTSCGKYVPWFISDQGGTDNLPLGGWPGRIEINLNVTFAANDSVQGRLEYWDYDPDRTSTKKCLNVCPQEQQFSGRSPYLGHNSGTWVHDSIPPYFDLFPYCNPRYLTGRSPDCLPFNFSGSFSSVDSCNSLTQRHTCDYAPCPPFSMRKAGLREFPFCAWADTLPCQVEDPGNPGFFVSEAHASCTATPPHPNNPGSSASLDDAAQRCDTRISRWAYAPPNSPGSGCSTCCALGPINCCYGAPLEASWSKCQLHGVRALSQPAMSRYLVGAGLALTGLDYQCALDNEATDQYRNRLIPFDCGTKAAPLNLAGPNKLRSVDSCPQSEGGTTLRNDCPADDVYIIFNVAGSFVTQGAFCPHSGT